jgi:hypothetical protein
MPGGYDSSFLGGGNDYFQGAHGPNSSYMANGPGNYFGTGLLNGMGRMFSGAHNQGFGGYQYLRRLSSNSTVNHSIMAACHMAYHGYGVVQNIVDLYADFASEGIELYHPDKSVRNFFNAWANKVKLDERIRSMFLNLFIYANVFVHRRWAKLSTNDKRNMKRADASEVINGKLTMRYKTKDAEVGQDDPAGFADWFVSQRESIVGENQATAKAPPTPEEEKLPENPDKRIPWGYTFLNPLQMEPRGSRLQGQQRWIMAIDKKDTFDLAKGYGLNTTVDIGKTEINLPKDFVNKVEKYTGPGAGYVAEVRLSKEELGVVQRPGKFDWFTWAVPFIFPSLRAISYKDCLRDMERRACDAVINSIFLFKLGNIDKGMPAEDEHFERFADMLQMPGNMMNIIWNEAIEAQVLQPNVAGIFDSKKHESADKDIMTALGIPEVLVGGKGGNFSNSFIAVAGVLEKLESYREVVKNWLMGELKVISDAMGFRKLPEVKFTRTSLKDEKARHQMILALIDRNILSADEALKELDTDFDTQVNKKTEEKTHTKKNGLMERRGPYEPKEPPMGPNGKPAAKPNGGSQKKTPNGRPGGSSTGPTGKQANPRGPKGQNVAEILQLNEELQTKGRAWLDRIEEFCNKRALKALALQDAGLKHLKQLKQEERDRLENLIYNVFSHMPASYAEPLQDDFIVNMLKDDDTTSAIKADVLGLYTDKIAQYSAQHGKQPTREMRRQFIVSCWTQQAIMNLGVGI